MSVLRIFAVLLLFSVGACSQTGANTQVMVTVDAEPGVQAAAQLVVVRVYGGPHGAMQSALPLVQDYPIAVPPHNGWPLVIALAPLDRDPTRIYRVEALAYDVGEPTDADHPIATVRAISGYVPGQTVLLSLLLQDACLGHECTDIELTCVGGNCVSAVVDPSTLPPVTDAGTRHDATAAGDGSVDGRVPLGDGGNDASTDGGATGCDDCDDAMDCTLDRCDTALNRCVHEIACDDGIECTADSCDASGTCMHVSMDSLCDAGTECEVGHCDLTMRRCVYVGDDALCDDGLACTDDVCGASGCTFPNLPPGTSCADATFCNGVETCNAGVCSSPGDPCPGASVCDTAMDACIGCVGDSDCPGDTTVDGPCVFSDSCDESGTLTRTVTTSTCGAGGRCDSVSTPTSVACMRETDGMSCPGGSCSMYTCLDFSGGPCDSSGNLVRSCVVTTCTAGTCGGVSMMETGSACSRPTEGLTCGTLSCGANYCGYAGACAETGVSQHDCVLPRCHTDLCAPDMFTEPSGSLDCNRVTSGMSCGLCLACAAGACTAPSCDAGFDAGTDAAVDAGTDAGVDAGSDAGPDASDDTGVALGDGGSVILGDGGG